MAFALLSARPNSHPFQERHISLKEVVKIGRAVAKTKPSSNNAVFDCKVLSRNHAIMWYENGKFLLQDTKSSNGTYVNSVRLSRGSEESEPYEIKSNDILQFGVEVVENSKNVTHGCIIGLVTLFHEDGTEALSSTEETPKGILSMFLDEKNVLPQDLWQLCQFLQDAVYREQQLESKLSTLQQLIVESHSTSHDAFQGFIKEDKLLSRLETLENQLEIATKDITNDEAVQKLVEYQEEKLHYETTTKENLQSILVEKAETLSKLADTERILKNTEEECTHLKMVQHNLQKELQQLIEVHKLQSNELTDLKLLTAKDEEKLSQYEKDNRNLKAQLDLAERRGSALAVDVESLQAECDFTKQQLNAIKEKLDQSMAALKEKEIAKAEDAEKVIPFASDHATLEKEVQNKSAYIQVLKGKLSEAYSELENMKKLNQDQSLSYPLLHQLNDVLLYTQSCIIKLGNIFHDKDKSIDLVNGSWNPMVNQSKNEIKQEAKIDLIVLSFIKMVGQVNNVLESITSELQLKIADKPNHNEAEELHNQIIVLKEKLIREQIKNKDNEENVHLLKSDPTANHIEAEELHNNIKLLQDKLLVEQAKNKRNEEHALLLEINSSNLQKENESLHEKINVLENDCNLLKQDSFIKKQLLESNQQASKVMNIQSLTKMQRRTPPTESYGNVTNTNDFHDVVCAEKSHVRSDIDDEFSDESILLGKMGNLVLAFFLLLVGLGALIMLGIIKVTAGTLPLVDERNWVEAWEHIIDYLF
ncbi:sarcolemmal membrane-associated protein isoform X3 [Hydra vulgaris]|uniref:Sarcolemmal membrane-associated protein isoform X3 n=1 Tax=Hydra vulgaris TaxID=6087 RepID=A0ABM4DG80_HYDVU